jgi:uncharacterized protein (TIGR02266 family)
MEYRILVADDEPYVRMAIKSVLEDLPAQILEAGDGDRALAIAKAERPDLILLDVKMPGLDGLQVAATLKQDPATAAIPLMFVSALGTANEKARGLEIGADDYIAKPIDAAELKARVRTILRRQRPSRVTLPQSGQLHAIGLPSLVRAVEAERRTTRLHLTRGDERGEITFREGHITRAMQGPRRGEAAVYHLLTWSDGSFQMAAVDPVQQVGDEVAAPNQGLLIEGARRLAEIPQLQARLLEGGSSLRVAPAVLGAVQAQASPVTIAILALLDGARTLEQILAHSALDPWGTLRLLLRLQSVGALEPVAPGSERRGSLRVRVSLPVEYQRLSAWQPGATFDLTSRGAFIRTSAPFEKDTPVLLSFGLPGREQPVQAVGRVVWANRDPEAGGGLGMGIHFQDPRPEDAAAIEAYLIQAIAAQLDEERETA